MKKILTLLIVLILTMSTFAYAIIDTDINIQMDQLDGEYTFVESNFSTAFDQLGIGEISRVVILTLPEETTGTLLYNEEEINVLPKGIDISDISKLRFIPKEGYEGEASFTWRGKTATKSNDTIFTTTINITNEYKDRVVDITVYKNQEYTFAESNFSLFNTLGVGDLQRVVIVTLPTEVTGQLRVKEQQIETLPKGIDLANISQLTFMPSEDFIGTTSFTWRGKTETTSDNNIFITRLNVVEMPEITGKDLDYSIDKNTTLEGNLKSNIIVPGITFELRTQPTNGTLTEMDNTTGRFIYVPNKDFVGTDSFKYEVKYNDKVSDVSTVRIMVNETEEVIPFYYEDMQEHWGNYSASHLADRGILVGEKIRGKYYFYPETTVKRSDFILTILSAMGIDPEDRTDLTFKFADDKNIDDWFKKYAYTAYEKGIIHGSLENGKLYLNQNKYITRSEAATIINNAIALADNNVDKLNFEDKADIPEWSLGAIKNMVGYEIITGFEDNTFKPATQITKAELAEMIYKTIKEAEKTKE